MEFHQNYPIYLQIADIMCENILEGAWRPGERIPSIRELAESIEVNPNTVMRTYGYMEDQGIVHNQRGIGFFLADGAYETTRELKKRIFVSRDLPQVFKTMDLLRMGFDDLKGLYAAHRAKEKEEKTV
jgi:DNA-binding transcriptional regulator YhcF (GntR family)